MKTLTSIFLFSVCTMIFLLAGCDKHENNADAVPEAKYENKPAAKEEAFDSDSWREIIPEECDAYFDGCNTCRRNPENGQSACTRKACQIYTRPYCLNDDVKMTDAHPALYLCEGDKRIVVTYGEYVSGDQKVKLQEREIWFRDPQTKTAVILERQEGGPGEKYSNGDITLYSEGDEASVKQGSDALYNHCKKQSVKENSLPLIPAQ